MYVPLNQLVILQFREGKLRLNLLIVVACAILFVVLEMPILRACFATTIVMMAVLLLVDTNASARLEAYKVALLRAEEQE